MENPEKQLISRAWTEKLLRHLRNLRAWFSYLVPVGQLPNLHLQSDMFLVYSQQD